MNDYYEDDIIINHQMMFFLMGQSAVAVDLVVHAMDELEDSDDEKNNDKKRIDHRVLPRSTRRLFQEHNEALRCVERDFTGCIPQQHDSSSGIESLK